MAEVDSQLWDERYRASSSVWSGNPNPNLVAEVADLAPDSALDAGSGEGADAIWLAERGWQVTAVEWSGVAVERARQHAERAAVADRVTWQQADLTSWQPASSWQLVSAQYLHLPPPQRQQVFARLADAVAVSGTLLLVGHHPSDLQLDIQRPKLPELFFTGDELVAGLPSERWRIVTNEARPRPATGVDGTPVTVHDTVLRAVRLA